MERYQSDLLDLRCMDCMDLMREMPDNSVDSIVTDPPYFNVLDNDWDRQWKTRAEFLEWMEGLSVEWERILKPNGSLYVFCYSKQAAQIEVRLEKRFNILNQIVWAKPTGYWDKQCKAAQRAYFPATERILFAEHYGADNIAKGEAGWAAKCDELRGFVFEPIRGYLASEWERAGLTSKDLNQATNSQMAGHYLTRVQWALPTAEKYKQMQEWANKSGGEYLRKEYEELRKEYEELRKEYEELRKEYEELRRPFDVTETRHTTDVWAYATEPADDGRHPCQKPLSVMEQIIRSSTKPGAVVFDPFMGSGSTAIAAARLGRKVISCELDEDYFRAGVERVKRETAQQELAL